MKPIRTSIKINAPLERVFATVADIHQFSQAIPHITDVKILSEQQRGLGTRFRETRLMKGKEIQTELLVTEYVENERIRLVADAHGTIWDSTFSVRPVGDQVEMELYMQAKAQGMMAKLMTSMVREVVAKAVENDMDAVKVHCEKC